MNRMMSIAEVIVYLEARGVNVGRFWRHAAGGDRTPILAEDIDRLIVEAEDLPE